MAVSITVPEIEPTKLSVGSTWTWKKSLPDFLPSDGWTLTYIFFKEGSQFVLTASNDSDDHLIEVAAATTASREAGTYDYESSVTNGTEVYTSKDLPSILPSGRIEIFPNYTQQTSGHDGRTDYEVALENVRAVMRGSASKDQLSYSISGRSLSRRSYSELIELEKYLSAKVVAEQIKAGKRKSRRIIRTKLSRG